MDKEAIVIENKESDLSIKNDVSSGVDDVLTLNDDPSKFPRKRSKVSRACDACRRRKVRCDAQWSSTLQSVVKVCTNCMKNNDECTFSRVPLKRGPSKGYVRESEEKVSKSRSRSEELSKQQLPFPTLQSKVDAAAPEYSEVSYSSATGQKKSTIILPPLIPQPSIQKKASQGYNIITTATAPAVNTPTVQQSFSPPIQAPFWKVPYEMPGANLPGSPDSSKSTDLLTSQGRRLSVESFTSTSSVGSRTANYPVNRATSSSTDTFGSDSEEGYYSTRSSQHSRKSSQSVSPRNSVHSFSSLIGKMNKNLSFVQGSSPTPIVHPFPPQNQPTFPYSGYGGHFNQLPIDKPGFSIMTNIPRVNSFQLPNSNVTVPVLKCNLRRDLSIYYAKYHSNFPILPFNENNLLQVVERALNDESLKAMIECFANIVHNLVSFQYNDNDANAFLLNFLMHFYPFDGKFTISDDLLIIFMTSIVLVNYEIFLNGNPYSSGFGFGFMVFNDFKVLENFNKIVKSKTKSLDSDDIRLYLPKLYFSLAFIYDMYCLAFGLSSSLTESRAMSLLYENYDYCYPTEEREFHILKFVPVAREILHVRFSNIYLASDELFLKKEGMWTDSNMIDTVPSYTYLFLALLHDKYQLFDFFGELERSLKGTNNDIDEDEDLLQDFQFKLLRLTKRLTQSVINFSNFISSNFSPYNSPGGSLTDNCPLLSPLSALSYSQAFKLIKLSKLIIDSLLNLKNQELSSRCLRINTELSIAFNLLSSTVSRGVSGASSTSQIIFSDIKMQLDIYNMSFIPAKAASLNSDISQWKIEFFEVIKPFSENDIRNGWRSF